MYWIIGACIVITIIYFSSKKKSKIWVPGPFCGVWINEHYRIILKENSVELWNNMTGFLDIVSGRIIQEYKGGYTIRFVRNNKIYNVIFFGIGDRVNFNELLFSMTEYASISSVEDLENGVEIIRERLARAE